LHDWIFGPAPAPTIPVCGNIEAHQSVLRFKTVQSRIVELPFDVGKWVDAGTLIARLDDSDYRQQMAINEAVLEMQNRQLAAARNRISRQPVERSSSTLPISSSGSWNTRAPIRCCRRAPYRRAVRPDLRRVAAIDCRTSARQALENAAERQVELAKTSIRNATETLKRSQIVLLTGSRQRGGAGLLKAGVLARFQA
jgi:HlyD family secretion protein